MSACPLANKIAELRADLTADDTNLIGIASNAIEMLHILAQDSQEPANRKLSAQIAYYLTTELFNRCGLNIDDYIREHCSNCAICAAMLANIQDQP